MADGLIENCGLVQKFDATNMTQVKNLSFQNRVSDSVLTLRASASQLDALYGHFQVAGTLDILEVTSGNGSASTATLNTKKDGQNYDATYAGGEIRLGSNAANGCHRSTPNRIPKATFKMSRSCSASTTRRTRARI